MLEDEEEACDAQGVVTMERGIEEKGRSHVVQEEMEVKVKEAGVQGGAILVLLAKEYELLLGWLSLVSLLKYIYLCWNRIRNMWTL